MAQDGPDSTASVHEGEVLAGKYRIDQVLGSGGMGVVVAAHHLQLDRRVAIKLLRPGMQTNQDAMTRFTREARAAGKITNEHVARVLDVGTLDTGTPYMVMEFLDGTDLGHRVHTHGPLAVEQAVDFVLQACVAVAEAHALGIVHRDLKPSNLFCVRRPDGQLAIKVLDFGISKITGANALQDMAMTQTTTIVGSPLYMSPEQMQAPRSVDTRTDIWALGVILYELVTGVVPFNGATLPELWMRIASGSPPLIRSLQPDAPPALDAVVARCLDKERERRFQNVGELARALAELGSPQGLQSVDRIEGIVQSSGLSTTYTGSSRSSRSSRPTPTGSAVVQETGAPVSGPDTGVLSARTRQWGLVGLVAAAFAIMVAIVVSSRTESPSTSVAPADGAVPLAPTVAPTVEARAVPTATATASVASMVVFVDPVTPDAGARPTTPRPHGLAAPASPSAGSARPAPSPSASADPYGNRKWW